VNLGVDLVLQKDEVVAAENLEDTVSARTFVHG
jgi:hypothetical protein